MKIIIAYNKHRHGGGSDVVAQSTIDLLGSLSDVEVVPFVRDSRKLKGFAGKLRALVSGCYAAEAVKDFSQLLDAEKPDVVHAQEIYPLISPWIFRACKKRGVPVVMTCHDYRMSCPIVTHFQGGALCYECSENNEFRCIRHNCCNSMVKSIAYAVRNYVGRKKRLFLSYVDLFLTPSERAKEILCRHAGLPEDRVIAVGNPIPVVSSGHETSQKNETSDKHEFSTDNSGPKGGYVAYAGRFEPEKGFDVLLMALADGNIPLKVAGDASNYLACGWKIPDYVEFTGHLSHNEIGRFYRQARMLVVPSLWHETFGLVVAEALSCGTPAIVSDLGALAEVAGPGGLVVPAGNAVALREAISGLWNDEARCGQMGEAGREHVKQYSDAAYVSHLLEAYEKVL